MTKPITVRQLIAELQKLPQDSSVVYSIDDEGNSFHYVYFAPQAGFYIEDDCDFSSDYDIKEAKNEGEDYLNYEEGERVVCIN